MILVTGAGGYIGCILVDMLLESGYKVRAVDRYYFGMFLPQDDDRLEIVQEDVRKLTPEHFKGVDGVIDLAALSLDPTNKLFTDATLNINYEARVRTATMAKAAGVKRYILPASCSIYGKQDPDVIATEETPADPLSTYSKSNWLAEQGTMKLADDDYCVVAARQSTVFGTSPRMRFDIAINSMTLGAFETGRIRLMRDGTQWRSWVHVKDTARAMIFMLEADAAKVNGEVYNVGSLSCLAQLKPLAELIAKKVPRDVEIEWYGDADIRSYRTSFDKVEALGFRSEISIDEGIEEICEALGNGQIKRTPQCINQEWYQTLENWHKTINDLEMYGGMIQIEGER